MLNLLKAEKAFERIKVEVGTILVRGRKVCKWQSRVKKLRLSTSPNTKIVYA